MSKRANPKRPAHLRAYICCNGIKLGKSLFLYRFHKRRLLSQRNETFLFLAFTCNKRTLTAHKKNQRKSQTVKQWKVNHKNKENILGMVRWPHKWLGEPFSGSGARESPTKN